MEHVPIIEFWWLNNFHAETIVNAMVSKAQHLFTSTAAGFQLVSWWLAPLHGTRHLDGGFPQVAALGTCCPGGHPRHVDPGATAILALHSNVPHQAGQVPWGCRWLGLASLGGLGGLGIGCLHHLHHLHGLGGSLVLLLVGRLAGLHGLACDGTDAIIPMHM